MSPIPANTTPIEDYALIGDWNTAALISRRGSVDWLCLPNFDSAAGFAALLGTPEHGRWLLGPADESARTTRRYLPDSAVLETTHVTAEGTFTVTDLMPLANRRDDLVRIVRGVSGKPRVRHEWVVRFGYGKVRPWVRRRHRGTRDELLTAVAGPDMLVLRGDRLPHRSDGRHIDEFTIAEGEELRFTTTWVQSWLDVPDPVDVSDETEKTLRISRKWSNRCGYEGRYADHVHRSALTLRLLTDYYTGGIVAAPTTSLPEDIGGERNWDYRYCWLRDAALSLEALLAVGYTTETDMWRHWLLRAVAGDPADMQIMYRIDGSRELAEFELDHLPGYADSRPVRIGNGAYRQKQTDVLGQVMMALERARDLGMDESRHTWALQRVLVDELADHWDEPDNGLWEIRGPLQHFTHSRVMVWTAFDCAIRAVRKYDYPGDVERWTDLRDRVRAEILDKGFDEEKNSFTQYYGTDEVDAALLVIPATGFLPGDDPRVLGTIAAVERDLLVDGLPLRYRTASGVDGLAGEEHPFLVCCFWLVSAYAHAGRLDEAHALMERLCGLANDVGLLAEEYDPIKERMIGNFPQAFSHLGLIIAADDLNRIGQGKRSIRETADETESAARPS
ncbi:glycoside hydrolase family 15 protein [Naumannella huperziae]